MVAFNLVLGIALGIEPNLMASVNRRSISGICQGGWGQHWGADRVWEFRFWTQRFDIPLVEQSVNPCVSAYRYLPGLAEELGGSGRHLRW